MKIPCHVIEDLLPLYHDGVCSRESGALVEEHVKDCAPCRKLLEELSGEEKPAQLHGDDSAPLKAIRDQWVRTRKKAFLKGTALAVLVCALVAGVVWGLTQWKCIPVPTELMTVSEVSRLSDGRIIYHVEMKDDKNIYYVKFATEADGSHYMTPMRSVIETKRPEEFGPYSCYHMVDVAENNAYQQKYGEGIVINACYLGTEEDRILLWEEGMELPAASEALEQGVFENSLSQKTGDQLFRMD